MARGDSGDGVGMERKGGGLEDGALFSSEGFCV